MAHLDYTHPFVLHTDASAQGLGAALYHSKRATLTAAEQNYHLHSSKLEFLALKWAITDQFRDYLYYTPHFTVYTDNNPLTYVLITVKRNAKGHRWVAELADFNFTMRYRHGTSNQDADGLSRIHMDEYMDICTEEVELDWIKATVEALDAQQKGDAVWLLSLSSQLSDIGHIMNLEGESKVQPLTPKELYEAQRRQGNQWGHSVLGERQATNTARKAQGVTWRTAPLARSLWAKTEFSDVKGAQICSWSYRGRFTEWSPENCWKKWDI